jgi:hypothetical protein
MRRIAVAIGLGSTLIASAGMAAETGVNVGGYHDAALRAAQDEWLGLSVSLTHNNTTSHPSLPGAAPGGASALTLFTPRFGGLGRDAGGRSPISYDARASQRQVGTGSPHRVEFGLNDTSRIAGVAVDWSAKANVSREPPTQAGDPSSFAVGGELAVSGVRFDAAYGEHATVLGVSGNRVTAGIGYGFGPVDARISYSVVSDQDDAAASLVTVGSRLTLQPGLVLQGDLAYAEEESSGDAATAGVVSLRFNF